MKIYTQSHANRFLIIFFCSTHGQSILVQYEVIPSILKGSTNAKPLFWMNFACFLALRQSVSTVGNSVFKPSVTPTLERPTEKVRKSCYKPLKMRNISPLKSIYTKFQVLGTSGKYRTDSLLRVRIFFKMSLFVTNSTGLHHIRIEILIQFRKTCRIITMFCHGESGDEN